MHLLQPLPITILSLSLAFAYYDWKTRQVPLWLLLTTLAIGLGVCLCGKREFISVLLALIPGILMILLSLVSGGSMGLGDGAFVCALSFLMDWKQVCIAIGSAFLTAGIVSLGMIVVAQIQGYCIRGKKLPFLCFMPLSVILAFLVRN